MSSKHLAASAAAACLALASLSASADVIDVNLAGWTSYGLFGSAANTSAFVTVAPGSTVTGFSYGNLSFSTSNGSWLSELTLSVNHTDGAQWLDWRPSVSNDEGSFGPAAGAWGGSAGAAGLFGAGGAFTVDSGTIWVTVYDSFDDPAGDNGSLLDTTLSAGTLRIFYTTAAPVPEPGTWGLMGLGLLLTGAAARRHRAA